MLIDVNTKHILLTSIVVLMGINTVAFAHKQEPITSEDTPTSWIEAECINDEDISFYYNEEKEKFEETPQNIDAIIQGANEGDSDKQERLGCEYTKGELIQQDYQKASSWFQKSALQDNASAQFNLAVLYEFGTGVPENPELALYWLTKASKHNNANAFYYLGLHYENGAGVKQSNLKAYLYYYLASENGLYVQDELDRVSKDINPLALKMLQELASNWEPTEDMDI